MSIKLRVALVFTLALAIAFAAGGWLFIAQLSAQLRKSTDQALGVELRAISRYAAVSGSAPLAGGAYQIQFIDPSGRVRRSSQDLGSAPMISSAQLQLARSGMQVHVSRSFDDDPYRMLAAPLSGHPGWVGVAAITSDTEGSTVSSAVTALLIGGSVFVLLAGLGAYWLAAAALSPVERMRREVAALSERDTEAAVRVPATRDELAALAGTMNALLARLHGALARQRGFVADASHELRTPLAVLGAELELAGRPGRSREELVQAVDNAEDEVARLTKITNDLLVLARSDEGKLEVRPVPTDVSSLLERSAQAAAGRSAAAGIRCVVDAPAGLVASLDEDRVRQAVDNMIDNALRFAPRGSEVAIRARSHRATLVIEVADSGPGFPADFLPHAFGRFMRPDTGRSRSGGGAGLGLAIVATIAAAHGGSASARNAQAGGAVVTIELPGVLSEQPA